MGHLKLFPLLSVSLALLVSGCGRGGNGVGHTEQTITFDNPGTQTAGTSLTLSAKASSGAAVTFASATPGVCTVSGTTATFGVVGTCTIDACQTGNSIYEAASQVAQSFTVNPAIGPTTTVYISGSAISAASTASNVVSVAEVWQLTSGNPTATATALSMPSGMTSSQANAIAVSGSDVYVAGTASNGTGQTAVYWLNNGTATILPSGMTSSQANAIAVSGSNVYVAGSGTNGATLVTNAAYWINGTPTTLPMPNNLTDSPATSLASGIAISGGDVYAVGSLEDSFDGVGPTGAYWVNGGEATLLPMPSGTVESYTTAIAVATQ